MLNQKRAAQIDEASIARLMESFYEKIRSHEQLGPIFNGKIGTTEAQWDEHKAKIGDFWAGMMLGSGVYAGNPLQAHIDLPPFPRDFFGLWLGLFEESLNEVYESEPKEQFLSRAQMIANRFMGVLYGG